LQQKGTRLTDGQHDDRARAPREQARCARRHRGFRYFFMRSELIDIRLFWG